MPHLSFRFQRKENEEMTEQFEKATTGIPAGRDKLHALADHLEMIGSDGVAIAIRTIVAEHFHRRKPTRKAAPRSAKMTPRLRTHIRCYAHDYPAANYMQIGSFFNVSSGRVSEALAGKRA